MDKQERAFWAAACLVFGLFIAVLYYPVFLGKVPFPRDLVLQFPAWAGRIRPEAKRSYADIGDLITFFYPARAFASRAIKEGVLPLWNPLLFAGEPFLANAQSSLFYPLNVPYYVLPLPVAWTASIMLRMFLAALFMTMFVRSIGASKTGSVFSGIVFASCAFMTVWQGQPITDSGIWLPFACLAVHNLHNNASRIWIALAAASLAMPLLAGHPETTAHVAVTASALALILWIFPTEPKNARFNLRFIATFAAAGILALGLASVQMLPTLEWLKQMGETFGAWAPMSRDQVLGWVTRDILRSPNSAGILIPEAAAYMAMISVVAAPLAVFHRPRIYGTFLFVVVVCAIAIAYGFEPMQTIVSHIPIFRTLKNYRMLVANFAIAGLGGLGISVLEKQLAWTRRKRLAAVGLVVSVFSFILLLNHRIQLVTKFKPEFVHRASFTRTLLILSFVLIGWKILGGLKGWIFPFAVCALALFDVGTLAFGYTGFAAPDEIFPSSPAFDFLLNSDQTQYRIIQIGVPYSPNANAMYGLQSADGYEIGFPIRQTVFLRGLMDPDSTGINFVQDEILRNNDRRLDLLNVKYIVLPDFSPDVKRFSQSQHFVQIFDNGNITIFKNPSVLPRAWIVPASGMEIINDLDKEVARIRNPAFDPLKSVTISDTPTALTDFKESAPGFIGQAEIVGSGINEIAIKTKSSTSGVLIVSQIVYPGWKAIVDGNEAQVLHADVTLTGIPVTAGAHDVRLVFQPLSFRIGLGITIFSATFLLGLVLSGLRSQRKGVSAFTPFVPRS